MIDFEKTRLAIKFRNTFTDPPFLLKVREYENVRGKKVFWMTTIAIILMGLILQLLVAGILNKPRSGLFSSDIYYIWIEGVKLANHQNPYARILNGSKEVNAKYPTYLPFNYLFVAALVELGYGSFTDWIFIFRLFSMVFFFLITFNLFFIFYKKSYSLSLFAVLFWINESFLHENCKNFNYFKNTIIRKLNFSYNLATLKISFEKNYILKQIIR